MQSKQFIKPSAENIEKKITKWFILRIVKKNVLNCFLRGENLFLKRRRQIDTAKRKDRGGRREDDGDIKGERQILLTEG